MPLQNICHIYTIEHEPGNVVTMLDERCEKCIDKVVVFPRVLLCTLTLILSIAGHAYDKLGFLLRCMNLWPIASMHQSSGVHFTSEQSPSVFSTETHAQ